MQCCNLLSRCIYHATRTLIVVMDKALGSCHAEFIWGYTNISFHILYSSRLTWRRLLYGILWKTRTRVFSIVSTMVTHGLSTDAVRTSVLMLWKVYSCNIPVSAWHRLNIIGGVNALSCPQTRISTIITTWRGITCRIAVTIEGVENAYLPGNVHFQYRP